MGLTFDWTGVLEGGPAQWLLSGLMATIAVTIVAGIAATIIAVLLVAGRLSPSAFLRVPAVAIVSVFRDSPLMVQLLAWYFAAWNALPPSWKQWVMSEHPWAVLPGNVVLLSPEFLAAAVGLAMFAGVFISEEIRAGLAAVPHGQIEAGQSQGMRDWTIFRHVLLPQGLANAAQPVIGQYLNMMKLSSLASTIGLAEITYQVRQIESFNSHALEAFAVGTVLYLGIGVVMSWAFGLLDGRRVGTARSGVPVAANEVAVAREVLEDA